VDVPVRTVLAGAEVTETTESTVPETGVFGVTVGLVTSLVVFAIGLFVISKDPRKMALLNFEREILEER
jgi:hypothetical protein